jgi:hypothetical protein
MAQPLPRAFNEAMRVSELRSVVKSHLYLPALISEVNEQVSADGVRWVAPLDRQGELWFGRHQQFVQSHQHIAVIRSHIR